MKISFSLFFWSLNFKGFPLITNHNHNSKCNPNTRVTIFIMPGIRASILLPTNNNHISPHNRKCNPIFQLIYIHIKLVPILQRMIQDDPHLSRKKTMPIYKGKVLHLRTLLFTFIQYLSKEFNFFL